MVPDSSKNFVITLMIVVLIALIGVNQYLISSASSSMTVASVQASQPPVAQQSGNSEYGVPLDNSGYQMLLNYRDSIILSADQDAEYNKLIGYDPNGKPYIDHPCCGAAISRCAPCGHGAAIQGLVKLLLQKSYSEQQILDEALQWNKMFFPEYYAGDGQQASGQVGGC